MVKPGYTQTDIGMLPDEWQVIPLQNLCIKNGIVRGPFGGALKKEIFVAEGYKVYEQGNAIYRTINRGSYYVDEAKYQEMLRFAVQEGDFIVSCSGTIGMIFQIPSNAPKGIINQALLKLTINNDVVNPQYFYLYFSCDAFNKRIVDDTQGGAMKNLVGMDVFRNTQFPIPPMSEQENIGNALADITCFLANLEELIAKKKAIKQGALQELLTGKKRLSGFSGEWQTFIFGELFDFIPNNAFTRAQMSDSGKVKNIHYGDILTKYGAYVDGNSNAIPYISGEVDLSRFADRCYLQSGDIIIADTAEDEAVGKALEVVNVNCPILAGQHTLMCRPKIKFADKFLGYYLNAACYHDQLLPYIVGTKVSSVSKASVAQTKLVVPEYKEQQAIAEILSNMDSEIEALEQKLVKYRQVKQGMMQQLLTGKIRLV